MHASTHSVARRRLVKRGLSALLIAGACLGAGVAEAKSYKGAEIYTQAQYKYGRIEVRMRSARGGGILSTFFTYKPGSEGAGVAWEEIDVEIFGKSNAAAFQSNILVGNPRMGSEQVHQAAASLADGYHTYTIEWTPTSVVWLLDGVETRRTTGGQANQLTTAHNFRFNLWASDVASWAGTFESSALPQYQYVNWIRYYRYENGAFVLDWSDDFNSLDAARWSKADWTFDGNLVDFDPNNAVAKDGTLVLCLTAEGQGGCSGAVPPDTAGNGGSGGGGTGGGGTGGTAGTAGTAGGGVAGMAGGGAAAGTAGAAAGAGGAAGGSGGTSGNGGVAATGGAPASTAGAPAMGGTASPTGGGASAAGAGVGGTAPSNGGNAAIEPNSASDSGCGCTVAGSGDRKLWLALGVALALHARHRRRRTRS